MAKSAPGNKKKTPAKGKAQQTQMPLEDRGFAREAIGVLLFFVGALLLYFLIDNPGAGLGRIVVEVTRGLAGALRYAVALAFMWAGVLVAFSGRERSMKKSRIALIVLLVLLIMTITHLFSVEDIMQGARFFNYQTFLARSYAYDQGGAGVLGALLCWPLYRAMGTTGAAMALIALILADLILQQKISLRKIGKSAMTRYDDFRVSQQQRAEEKMAAREAQAVIPKVALRDIEMEDPFAKYLGDNAPTRKRTGQQMRIEKITGSEAMPGEPEVESDIVIESNFNEDIPDFLSGRRKKVKVEKLHIKEPGKKRSIFDTEPIAPMPNGSEVAERPVMTQMPNGSVRYGQTNMRADLDTGLQSDDTDWASVEFFQSSQQGQPADDAALDAFMSDDANPLSGADIDVSAFEAQMEAAKKEAQDAPPFDVKTEEVKKAPKKRAEQAQMSLNGGFGPQIKPVKPSRLPIARPIPADEPEYIFPPIDILEPSKPSKVRNQAERDLEKGKKLIETLSSFGISAKMIGIAHGPTVTRFELTPAAGVKVSRITALADDIALNLAAVSVRIEAPIPGKPAVGVEVPNDHIETVPIRDVLESPECRKHASRLAVALGRDNAGRYIIADLAKMPHVLIAGQTGSGKSVCINCIIASILYRATPEEVRLIMIDPKVVELSCYNGIPHLLVPVVTDPKKAASALEWAVVEMGARYKKFAELGVRDMKGYNQRRPSEEPAMPQIVIIIDELADLMMVTPGEVEDAICRLAQLARAAGIHLVIATQRPSVNVITGVIKANIPSRIAFTVASQIDSRTILDVGGAEKLLGRGDMLYAPSGMGKTRVQGAWLSDEEVHKLVEFLKVRNEANYNEDVIEHMDAAVMSDADRADSLEAFDELLPSAIELVVDAESASVSMLQRRLRVGHSRAGRLIDEMEVRGIVGPDEGSKSRKVLISREQYKAMYSN